MIKYILSILIVLAIGSALHEWVFPPIPVSYTEFKRIPQIKLVEKLKRVEVPVTKVVVIEKAALVEAIPPLPSEIKDDPNKQITTTGVVPCNEDTGTVDVLSVLDTNSGESVIIAKPNPPSLFAFKNTKELGLRYGISTLTPQSVEAYGRWTFFRVESLNFAASVAINNNPEAKGMVEAYIKW